MASALAPITIADKLGFTDPEVIMTFCMWLYRATTFL